jgi:outer membrane protein assembly factor BamA
MRRLVLIVLAACACLAPAAAAAQQAAPASSQAPLPPAAVLAQPAEVVAEVRIHGNYATPDAAVLAIAGLAIGQPLAAGQTDAIAERLRRSGKFESVEVRKRYRSLEATEQVVVIIIVQEHPGVEIGGVMPGPMKRLGNASMVLPILDYVDGYGFTAGGRFSFVNVLGKGGHVILPMTFGSTRQVTAELDKTFAGGAVRRLRAGGSVVSRENPGYDIRDRRNEIWIDAMRPIAGVLSVGASAGWSDVHFGETTDQLTTYGARVVLDTRQNPAFPRDAIYASAGWIALDPKSGPGINRYRLEARGYLDFIKSSVIAVRALSETVDAPLPAYERAMVGGFSSLRGFRAGSFVGDNIAAGSIELRVPLNSPMGFGQTGLKIFGDAASAYDHGSTLKQSTFHYGWGGGWYLRAPLVQLDLDVAYGIDSGARVHVLAGLKF